MPVVCLLEHRDLADTLFRWSITRLPGTVFTDYTNHPVVLARDLIHEAGHQWLNDALALAQAVLPDEVTFYSPWRATQRPVPAPVLRLRLLSIRGAGAARAGSSGPKLFEDVPRVVVGPCPGAGARCVRS
ncbi:aKG-HExxH-type peptide beta-hydroxylase [Streptomyces sioyaensis]|uniref:aKG-HExxH-type peptide beta-hydroxylase n=1 Tax=Streptomyces sioyaensis TaxID=67364 RepID=UPI0037B9866A